MGFLVGMATLILAVLVHTAVLFRWGGSLTEMVRRHDKELDTVRHTQTEHTNLIVRATVTLERVERRLDALERIEHE